MENKTEKKPFFRKYRFKKKPLKKAGEKGEDTKAPKENKKQAPAKKVEAKVVQKPKKEEKMYVIPLGGLDEVGKNMTLFQYRDEIICVDAGITFPDDDLLGIDFVIPDYSYIESNKDKVKGLVITHGHEDHIGGIPYLYQIIDKKTPMYGGKLTLALVESKFERSNFDQVPPNRKIVKGRDVVKIGKYFEVEFIKVTHSIADAYSVAIKTPAGVIVHTGDFKIDLTPVDGQRVDFSRFSELGDEGVDLLLSDSTNAMIPGFTPSERSVGDSLRAEFKKAKGRIIIAAFASHVHRLQQIVDIAKEHKRKIAIDGRSMIRIFEIASRLNYLKIPEDLLVNLSDVPKLEDHEVILLCTGTQGEPMAALSRIAKGMHKHIKLRKGDTVFISATPIPGNERAVITNINNLLKKDADVVYRKIAGIHVSGHAAQEEQKLMLNLVRPKNFMPVHGEYMMLQAHKEIAVACGVKPENVLITNNGTRVEVTKSYAEINGKVPAGVTLVDGLGVGDIGNIVLRDRQRLSEDGVLVVVLTLDRETKRLLAGPDIITRGFVYSRESDLMMKEAEGELREKLSKLEEKNIKDWSKIKGIVKDSAGEFFYEKLKRRPVILPIIMEV